MNRAADHLDPFNGRQAEHLHHVTGKDADGRYFDPMFMIPLTSIQHVREHQSWGPMFKDRVHGDDAMLRLRRAGHLLVRLGDHHAGDGVVLPALFVHHLGLVLHEVANERKRQP